METDTGGPSVRFPYLSEGLRLEWGVGPFRIFASTHERS